MRLFAEFYEKHLKRNKSFSHLILEDLGGNMARMGFFINGLGVVGVTYFAFRYLGGYSLYRWRGLGFLFVGDCRSASPLEIDDDPNLPALGNLIANFKLKAPKGGPFSEVEFMVQNSQGRKVFQLNKRLIAIRGYVTNDIDTIGPLSKMQLWRRSPTIRGADEQTGVFGWTLINQLVSPELQPD
jgi:hypothetical protein